VEKPPQLLKPGLVSEPPSPRNGYLAGHPQLASRLQQESQTSSAAPLKAQTCPILLSCHLPQDAGKTPTGANRVAW